MDSYIRVIIIICVHVAALVAKPWAIMSYTCIDKHNYVLNYVSWCITIIKVRVRL